MAGTDVAGSGWRRSRARAGAGPTKTVGCPYRPTRALRHVRLSCCVRATVCPVLSAYRATTRRGRAEGSHGHRRPHHRAQQVCRIRCATNPRP
eukprot:1426590-Rhodomonas_salina.1